MQRLAKAISNAGICSRRQAELLISSGKVKVNGIVINTLATNVDKDSNIEVAGKSINQNQQSRLWTYYKPAGLITTHKDTHGRDTVFDSLSHLPRIISIGRLDLNSEGLLLVTNNGSLARNLELPANKLERIYKVRAFGRVDLKKLQNAELGVKIREIVYRPKSIKMIKYGPTNSWFEVTLTEGKNREIRKIFNYFGLVVNRLIRISYGPFILGSLKPGQHREQHPSTFKDFLLC